MSFIYNLQHSTSIGGSAQMLLATGDSGNNIETHAKDAIISTGNGDQNIAVDVRRNMAIDTGRFGNDYIVGNAGNSFVNTHECDDTVVLDCDNLDLEIGNGNDNVLVSARGSFNINGGFGNKTIVAESLGNSFNSNCITLRDGNHTINAMGNNLGIYTGNGNQTIGTIGNNQLIMTGHGNNTIGFYGDNINLAMGNGNHDIRTIDNWLSAGKFTNVFDSSNGLFDHNVGLASTLDMNTAVYSGGIQIGNMMYGANNVNMLLGKGTFNTDITSSYGNINLYAQDNANINIRSGYVSYK